MTLSKDDLDDIMLTCSHGVPMHEDCPKCEASTDDQQDTELREKLLRALMTAPNNMQEKVINDRAITVFEIQDYKPISSLITQHTERAERLHIEHLERLKLEFDAVCCDRCGETWKESDAADMVNKWLTALQRKENSDE